MNSPHEMHDDVSAHGMGNDNETVLDDDVAGHGKRLNDNETVLDDDA